MEKKSNNTTDKVLEFLGKFSNSNCDAINSATGIGNKLTLMKILKRLTEEGKVIANKEATPPSYSLATKNGTAKKEIDEVYMKTEGRDTSKYLFEGKALPKSRVVLEVIRKYVSNNKRVSLKNLKEVFKDHELQRKYGLIVELTAAKKIAASSGRERHFVKDTLSVGGKKVCVSNQWTADLFFEFKKIAGSLKYQIRNAS